MERTKVAKGPRGTFGILRAENNQSIIMHCYFKAQEEGHHVDLPYVRLIPVRAFRLESFSNSTVTVDGELVRTKVSRAVVAHSSCNPRGTSRKFIALLIGREGMWAPSSQREKACPADRP